MDEREDFMKRAAERLRERDTPHRWMNITRARPFSTVTCRCGWTKTDLGARRAFKVWARHVQAELGTSERAVWSQAWFWTETWQQGEAESDAEYAAGNYETFSSVEALLNSLDFGLGEQG